MSKQEKKKTKHPGFWLKMLKNTFEWAYAFQLSFITEIMDDSFQIKINKETQKFLLLLEISFCLKKKHIW